jgi:hypothetical protein
MDQPEHIIETQLVTAMVKCSFFGAKQFIYLHVHYTSKANWHVSTDTPYYDEKCPCYKQDVEKLCKPQIEDAKKLILERIKTKHIIDRVAEDKANKKAWAPPPEHRPLPKLFKNKDITIREVDWRD